jgi:ribosomal protein S18 acetylase RimI-like enzyme
MPDPVPRFVVRHARLRDVPCICDLLQICWHSTYDPILGRLQAERRGRYAYSKRYWAVSLALSALAVRKLTVLVAMHDSIAVGNATAQRDGAEVILYGLYVHPDWKRQGVGSALLEAVIAEHPSAKAIRLEVLKDNTAAIDWYKARGFSIYGETANATGLADVSSLYMDKALNRP